MARRRNVEGVENVRRVFRAFSEKSAQRVANALNTGVAEIADRARVLVPKDTGELRDAIDIRTAGIFHRSRRGSSIVDDNIRATAGVYFPYKSTTKKGWYARFVEFGAAKGTSPQPFVYPAFFSVRRRVLNRVRSAIRAAAREVVSRGRN